MSDSNTRTVEDITVQVDGDFRDGEIKTHETQMDVTISTEYGEFYNDGRQAVRINGTVEINDVELPLMTVRTMKGLEGPCAFKGWVEYDDDQYERLPDSLGRLGAHVHIRDDSFDRVYDVYQQAQTALSDRREQLLEELEPTIEVNKQWEEGKGETHAYHATATITAEDGRSLDVKFRNAVDIGFQVFLHQGGEKFDNDEFDALISFAHTNSPISRGMRL